MQFAAMRDYAKRRGWTVATESKEVGSGAKTRPLRDELLKAARRRELDYIVVWRLDRWGRSLLDLISTLAELASLGVGFASRRPSIADAVNRILKTVKGVPDSRQHVLAGTGEHNSMAPALEQPNPDQPLERYDMLRQRALRDEQCLGRAGKASVLGDAFKGPKRVQRQVASIDAPHLSRPAPPAGRNARGLRGQRGCPRGQGATPPAAVDSPNRSRSATRASRRS